MARAIWSGVLSFGLVSVPVELYTATEAHGPVFHQFEKGTADRIRYQRVNERTEDEVDYSDTVKGADVGGGHYVLLDQDELDSIAPGRSRLMEIRTRQLTDAMSGPWKPSDYRDTYTGRVNDLIGAKKHKKEFQPAEEAPAATNVVDLTEALRSSVEAAGKKSGRKAPKPARKKTASRKTARRGSGRRPAA